MRTRTPLLLVVTSMSIVVPRSSGLPYNRPEEHPEPVTPRLSVEIFLPPRQQFGQQPRYLGVRFRNLGSAATCIFRPADGSEWCWIMPYYRMRVIGPDGQQLDYVPRCGHFGLWADTKWPKDYLIEVRPGESKNVGVLFPFSMKQPGTYRIQFEYEYEAGPEALRGIAQDVWCGKLVAPEIQVKFVPK